VINGQDEAHYPPKAVHDSWFISYSGRVMHVLDPHPEDIEITDIAWALSQTCRFGGHTRAFYSVAEHSFRMSWAAQRLRPENPELALVALLHDATEAYLGDVISPLKWQLSDYKAIERMWERAIGERFGLVLGNGYAFAQLIKELDLGMLMRERVDLVAGDHAFPDQAFWLAKYAPVIDPITSLRSAQRAFNEFMNQFELLGGLA
jgi:5'-deoxynucleotidase YfbR-like HD superfamily hydrolase